MSFPALAPSVGNDMPERYLCPIRALRYYLSATKAGNDDNNNNNNKYMSYIALHPDNLF